MRGPAIRILPDGVIARIRAGEVVERPASLVKELVENALDAGAASVRISVSADCLSRMSVEDDGLGMAPADLALCLVRHATSKLEGDDPAAAMTLGFRGEALAAAATACEAVRVRSRQPGGDGAWLIAAERGQQAEPRPTSGPPGTAVTCSGLFAGLPGRSGSLASARSERAAVTRAVEGMALARPDVAFTLSFDERDGLRLPPTTWDGRAAAVMGPSFASNAVPFAGRTAAGEVRGLAATPTWRGHSAAGQRILVNGRAVRDRTIQAAVRSAYAGLTREASPAVVVDLSLPPGAVDPNVHPTKAEVRLRDPAGVADLVRSSLSSALRGSGPLSAASLAEMAGAAARPVAVDGSDDTRRLPLGRPLGLALGCYVVSETSDGIILIDLHAAHERLVAERIKSAALGAGLPPRPLARPVVIEIGEQAAALIEAREADLLRLGIAMQALDGGMAAVTAVPPWVPDARAEDMARDVADALAADPHADPLGPGLDALCAAAACRAAFRDGEAIGEADLCALLREIERCGAAAQCPHGRPTSIVLPRGRVEAMFGRR